MERVLTCTSHEFKRLRLVTLRKRKFYRSKSGNPNSLDFSHIAKLNSKELRAEPGFGCKESLTRLLYVLRLTGTLQKVPSQEGFMFYFLRILILFFGVFKFSPPAWAENFSTDMTQLIQQCAGDTCKAPYKKEFLYENSRPDLNIPIVKRLKAAAIDQAQIWADTILEGDYATDYKTRLDKAVALYESGSLVAYYITYSEGAWDTSTCRYDGINDSTLSGCKAGRIVESVYLSPDFSEYHFVEEDYAHFIGL